MFDTLKKLFSKSASSQPAAAPANEERIPAPPPSAAAARTAQTAGRPIAPMPGVIPNQSGDTIVLPLNEILSRLPSTLAPLVLSRSGGTFSLPAGIALEQLRTGLVRIPFSQLRKGSPPGTFSEGAAHDQTLVDLPLSLVLAAIGPAGLARRGDQKRVEVPDEVMGVFGAKGQKNQPVVASAVPAAKPATAAPAPPAPAAPKPLAPQPAPAPSAPIAPRPAAPVTPIAPVAASTAPARPTTSIASTSTAPKPASPLPFATQRPEAPPPALPRSAPAPSGDATVIITVEAVSGAWPEPVRNEIQQFKLTSAMISIPVTRLDPGMKSGRVAFTWGELCGWLSTSVPSSANGDTVVELPLKVIAPLFLAAPRALKTRKAISIGENVPDLFAGAGKPVASQPADAPPPSPSPVAPPAMAPTVAPPAPVPVPVPAVSANVLGEIFGHPSKVDWTPAEIVQKIQAMPGVAGALLASRDGLLVAGQVPPPMKTELIAAFLPQMLSQISNCTEEVHMGTVHTLRLSTGQTNCLMLKAGKLCLAVLSKTDQKLPESVLERIAAQLAQ
jgi:predicted regulator of Ras-like GTPase activity (Roadblock/LC7/MglB family)